MKFLYFKIIIDEMESYKKKNVQESYPLPQY